jgi:hypothetical protein
MALSRPMIVIIAEPIDVHAKVVARKLEIRGEPCAIVNAADFPQRSDLTTEYGPSGAEHRLTGPFGEIAAKDIQGLWIRRVSAHDISPAIADATVAHFSHGQCRDHFLGWAGSVDNVINPRFAEMRAELKPLQLQAALAVGLRVPKTMISNNPDHIRRFVDTLGTEAIFKTLTATAFQFTATTVLDAELRQMLDTVRLAPAIFQERIVARTHIRATVVDDAVLAASITPHQDYAQLDWRLDRNPEIRPYALPEDIEARLRALVRAMGLRYGAIDLIHSVEGEYVFLEINPGGQFLFVEIQGGVPISDAVATALADGRATA